MLDGTPVLDIKPYIPSYDIPPLDGNIQQFSDQRDISHKGDKSAYF